MLCLQAVLISFDSHPCPAQPKLQGVLVFIGLSFNNINNSSKLMNPIFLSFGQCFLRLFHFMNCGQLFWVRFKKEMKKSGYSTTFDFSVQGHHRV